MNFTKRGRCECDGPLVFRPTAANGLLGQWVHIDGSRRCKDGGMATPVTGTVKKNIEDVQVTQGRL